MIAIRRFLDGDAMAVARLEQALFDVPYDVPWPLSVVRGYLKADHRIGWVATKEGDVCGYLFASVLLEEANIDAIGTDPAHQRQGIARRMLAHAIERFRESGVRTVWLEVAAKNAPAHAFYLSEGFEEISRRRDYYTGPKETSDAILMRLILTGSPSR